MSFCFGLRSAPWYALVWGSLATHCLPAANSSVSGLVVDDDGHGIVGARVFLSYAAPIKPPIPAPPVITGPLAAMVDTGAQGDFRAENLPAGQYIACAQTVTPGYLDPCHWSASALSFAVAEGKTTSGVKVVMSKGSVVRVHIRDPHQFLKANAGPADLDLQVHVVTSKGMHYAAPIQSKAANGRDHAITIPFDTPVTLQILSPHFAVEDETGKSITPAGTRINNPHGATPPVITYTVSGKR